MLFNWYFVICSKCNTYNFEDKKIIPKKFQKDSFISSETELVKKYCDFCC